MNQITESLQSCFNPRARAGRDLRSCYSGSRSRKVSIHAPARGATPGAGADSPGCPVSIHAPARGATKNCRHCEQYRGVSIHAPARGATQDQPLHLLPKTFQSTRPRGARLHFHVLSLTFSRCFNPRARAGRDGLADMVGERTHDGFNPRARAGRDSYSLLITPFVDLFQSTRPRGARPNARSHKDGKARVSIHAPARGATPAALAVGDLHEVSIHAPARGATSLSDGYKPDKDVFQSTRPRGARLPIVDSPFFEGKVSIHAPARGATVNDRCRGNQADVSI